MSRDEMIAAVTVSAESVCSLRCPSVKRTDEQWTHVEECRQLRAVLAALWAEPRFDPSNHHNALACPYCNPDRLELARPVGAEPPSLALEAHGYLSRLLTHYAPQCQPLPDLLGVCSQIDNLLTGAAWTPAQAEPAAPEGITERELIARFIVNCRESRAVVQVFDVLADMIRKGRHLDCCEAPDPVGGLCHHCPHGLAAPSARPTPAVCERCHNAECECPSGPWRPTPAAVPGEPKPDCPLCRGTGRADNAQFGCSCRYQETL